MFNFTFTLSLDFNGEWRSLHMVLLELHDQPVKVNEVVGKKVN